MKYKLLFILVLPILFIGCGKRYSIKGNRVYQIGWNEGVGNYEIPIDNADAKTFRSLDLNCHCNITFGMDKDHLFIDRAIIEGIDPNSFAFIGNGIFRDKDSAYFFGFWNNIQNCRIHNVNPNNIKLIKYLWAKSDNKLIYANEVLALDDLDEFKPADRDWGKTKTKIIWHGVTIKDADYESFHIINYFQGVDKNHTYSFGRID